MRMRFYYMGRWYTGTVDDSNGWDFGGSPKQLEVAAEARELAALYVKLARHESLILQGYPDNVYAASALFEAPRLFRLAQAPKKWPDRVY